jgi:hypothetical protein
MAGVFASGDYFEVFIRYVNLKTASGIEIVKVFDESTEKGKQDIEKYGEKVQVLKTQWVAPNWKQSNELLRKCMRYDAESGKRELDWPLYRALLIEMFMKKWDITSTEGGKEVPVPLVRENIDRLDAQIAVALVDKFIERTNVSEEELGK